MKRFLFLSHLFVPAWCDAVDPRAKSERPKLAAVSRARRDGRDRKRRNARVVGRGEIHECALENSDSRAGSLESGRLGQQDFRHHCGQQQCQNRKHGLVSTATSRRSRMIRNTSGRFMRSIVQTGKSALGTHCVRRCAES